MARSRLVFSRTRDGEHILVVDGDPDKVIETLRNGWAQLNRAPEGKEPVWVWVNEDRVLYVEPDGAPPPPLVSY